MELEALSVAGRIRVEPNDENVRHGDDETREVVLILATESTVKWNRQQILVHVSHLSVDVHVIMKTPSRQLTPPTNVASHCVL